MRKYVFTCFIILIVAIASPIHVKAQNTIDSLTNLLQNIHEQNERLYTIEKIIPGFIRERDSKTLNYLYTEGINLANKLKSDTSLAYIYLHKGIDEYFFGNYVESKEYYLLAIDQYSYVSDKIKTKRVKVNEANAYNNLAIINKKQSLHSIALQNFQIALTIRSEIGDSIQIANTYLNIGNLYNSLGNINKAKEYYTKARLTYLKLGNDFGLASANHNLGLVHERLEEYSIAIRDYKNSYKVYQRLDREKPMATALNNLGNAFLANNQIDSVKPYLDKAYQIMNTMKDSVGICNVLINYGLYYTELKKHDLAEKCFNDALEIAKDQDILDKESKITNYLADHFAKIGNYKLAFEYLNNSNKIEEEYSSDEDEERFERLDAYYREEANKKNLSIKELELKNSRIELRNNEKITFILLAGLFIIFFLLAYQIKRYNITNSIKNELEMANSQLKTVNEEYQRTLISKEEKEILLQEIHHRVKNNLQIINSLLRFQAMKGDETTRDLILELQTRITAMSLLHEQLYMNNDFTKINVSDYLELLLNNLSSAYARNYEIETKLDIKIDNLDLDTLHPLGLLVNEIVSNSLKHAFNEDIDLCKVYLSLYKEGDFYHLKVGDNGIGFDADLLQKKDQNLGIELIDSLTKQLDGSIETIADKGTHYYIKFKIDVNEIKQIRSI